MRFEIDDYVFIHTTGDVAIDVHLGEQMVVTGIIAANINGYCFTRYELGAPDGSSITVIDGEIEKGEPR